jgi:SOS regulatory protein LexA
VGQVPAGPLNYASEEVEEWLPVPRSMGVREGYFLLRVKGDSMTGDHIQDGDVLIVDPSARPKEGDIVVAVVEGEATVKHLHVSEKRRHVELRPSNPAFPPIRVRGEELHIAGKVAGLLRSI